MNEFDNIKFPIVRNIKAKTISDEIVPMNAEETRKAMAELFKKFFDKTGKTIKIVGDGTSPVNVLFPDENKQDAGQ